VEIKEQIKKEIEKIPEHYLQEILDFIRFLERKAMDGGIGTSIASESSLSKSWLRPEEDEAWKDL
jgi:mRNA-degrading endonuclease RelE of RelBE toxin-antitoxin system